jgi:hypothetical protein
MSKQLTVSFTNFLIMDFSYMNSFVIFDHGLCLQFAIESEECQFASKG